MFVLVSLLISIAIGIVEGITNTMIAGTLFSLAILIPNLAIGARRLHDIGKSGWWQLIMLVPIVGIIVLIVWLATKGDAGPNAYGNPKSFGGETTPVSTPDATPMDAENNQ